MRALIKKNMTLKEHIDSVVMRHNLMRNETKETIEQLEKIADEFAIGFSEWVDKKALSHRNSVDYHLYISHTISELLEIYKKEKGL